MFDSLNTSASALTAQRLRMDVVSSNIANAQTTRGTYVNGKWEPYRRKMVEMEPIKTSSFNQVLQGQLQNQVQSSDQGVKVTGIVDDPTPFNTVYDPSNPDADASGYVQMPNVDLSKEMVDLLSSSRSYDANVTAFNTGKSLYLKALQIGE
ncbi:flagellar basal body rod protein FlgC [Pullulanibacillus sp. KACC 23026]|uniref:flagellar basal body rod protein FlgC n=1 Tax=Pullulanibacillus sp. KACC 23026 TaxID=3028315 RepID=UPI0023B0406B|nr:flagellar basal body rod protein FlgC [Pullulanibacillus sp. KACC 23026]WEG11238.1 flagellar basal body rod protein FlgC [Pullulanibacillus sp. KACC 23026]